MLVDLCIAALLGGITYALMSEGLWGSALTFFNVLFAALISFNFYEPLAQLIIDQSGNDTVGSFADSVSMMVIFTASLLLFRLATDSLAPAMVRFPTALYQVGRVIFGFGGAVVMIAMLLLGYQASPVQKKMLGVMDYKHQPFYKERFDRDFLAFFQYTTGYTFARNGVGDPDPAREFPARPMLFDPKAEWLLYHQLHRPYGSEAILEEAPEPGAPAATPGAPGGEPGAPVGPTGPGGRPGPGIPGGTAGAAAGLAPTTP